MRGIGRREAVGLAVLVAGLAIGFLFLNPASSESTNGEPGDIHLGETVTPTPRVTPTATPTPPPLALPAPTSGWFVQFFEVPASGGELETGEGFSPTVDMTYPGTPFPDVKDDRWFLRVTNDFALEAGRYELRISHDCDLHVSLDGQEVAHDPDGSAAKTADVAFQHGKGVAHVVVECRDVSGPFKLQLLPG